MPPPGASAPAFAATVEPAFTQITSDLPPTYLQSDSSNERVLRNGLHPASILDFRLRLANRCKLFPVYALFRASILDFRPELANRCKVFPVYCHLHASILDFRARLANRCRFCLFMPSCVHRFLISSPDLRIAVSICPETPSSVQ